MNNLIKELAKLAKVSDVDAFAEALKSEKDTDYTLDTSNLIVRTKEEDESFKSNISKDIKDKAFSDAFEIQIKNMKKDLGLDFEGKKSDDFINAFKTKILNEAKVEPNKRISELENSLTALNEQVSLKDSEIESIKSSFRQKETRLQAENFMPELPSNIGLDKKEATDLFLMKYEIKDDGVYSNNERLVDTKTAQPLGLKDVVSTFVNSRGWNIEQPTGRGGEGIGGNGGTGNVPTTLEEFNDEAQKKGLSLGSKDYNAYLAEVVKENPEIII